MKQLLLILVLSNLSSSVIAQNSDVEKSKINYVILELFNAYRQGDSARVAATFTKDAILQTLSKNKDGITELSDPVPISKFLNYIGSGLNEVHDERLWETQVFYDDFMATVWTRYAFFLGKKFHHCGTEAFHLRKVEGEWKIFQLIDTRQMENCQVPEIIK